MPGSVPAPGRDDAGGTRRAVPWRGAHLPGHAVRVGPPARGQRPLGASSGAAWRELGHEVVILAPARSAALLRDGRHRLRQLERGDATALAPPRGAPLVVAVGLAVPVRAGGPARSVALPVAAARRAAARARRRALRRRRLPRRRTCRARPPLALRESTAPTVATWFRAARGAAASDADAHVAVTEAVASALEERLGDRPAVSGVAVDLARFAPGTPAVPPLVAVESAFGDRGALKGLLAALGGTARGDRAAAPRRAVARPAPSRRAIPRAACT